MSVTITGFSGSKEDREKIVKLVEGILKEELSQLQFDASLSFVSPAEIRRINREYRQKDEVTDVLSFDLSFPGLLPVSQVVVCSSVVFPDNFWLTIAHGFLHVVGYDHETKKEMSIMKKKEEKYLNKYVS